MRRSERAALPPISAFDRVFVYGLEPRLRRWSAVPAGGPAPFTFTIGVRLHFSHSVEYHFPMQIASGTIVGGKIVVEGLSLPDGTSVTVLARGDEVAVRLPLEQETELLDALDEADREEGISAEELFARLRRFG